MSNIEWTDETWNPIVGCSKVSPGCQNCYAINQAYRNAAMGAKLDNPGRLAYYDGLTEKRGHRVEWTGKVNFVPEALEIPLKRKKPTTWFVNSMSDLFHESVTDEQLDQIFAVMALTPHHTYQVLTKRPDRMLEYFSGDAKKRVFKHGCSIADDFPKLKSVGHQWHLPNVWLGITVENQATADERIPLLLQTPAAVRFLSCEPLLEPLDIGALMQNYVPNWNDKGDSGCRQIDWVIVGGESGPCARPCDIAWIRSIVAQCKAAEVLCFVKQLGSKPQGLWVSKGEQVLFSGKGSKIDEWPADLRVQQFPAVTTA